jgi:hypothetical protein
VAISSLHQVNRRLREDIPASAALARLSVRLRSDVHEARSAEVVTNQEKSTLKLALTDPRTIEYSTESHRVIRTEQLADGKTRRDAFELPRESQFDWTVEADPAPLVRLAVRYRLGRIPDAADDVHGVDIQAAVGSHHRGDVAR